MAKGYCALYEIEEQLGVSLTGEQALQAQRLIAMAESLLDQEMGHAYGLSTQTNEAHYSPDHLLYLNQAPITSVTSVTSRVAMTDTTETTLVAGTDYEVRDLTAGLIYLVTPYSYERVRVTYVPVATVPALLNQAAIETVATWLQGTLNPGLVGVQSYKLPDLEVQFVRGGAAADTLPPRARDLIGRLKWPVVA